MATKLNAAMGATDEQVDHLYMAGVKDVIVVATSIPEGA